MRGKVLGSIVTLPNLDEADEAEALARGSANLEVAGHVLAVQVAVVVRAIILFPLSLAVV